LALGPRPEDLYEVGRRLIQPATSDRFKFGSVCSLMRFVGLLPSASLTMEPAGWWGLGRSLVGWFAHWLHGVLLEIHRSCLRRPTVEQVSFVSGSGAPLGIPVPVGTLLQASGIESGKWGPFGCPFETFGDPFSSPSPPGLPFVSPTYRPASQFFQRPCQNGQK